MSEEHFSYDGVGNRKTDAKTDTNNWSYNKNNELQSFDNTSFKYNLNGQLTEKTVAGSKTYFSYNLDGRLSEIRDYNNQIIAQYQYDPFGRRTQKSLPQINEIIYFHYSDEGLVGEYSGTGNLIQSYGYKPDSEFTTAPVFTQRPDFVSKSKDGYVYFINDHLGTPQKLITETGRKVWEASADAFGETLISNNEFRNPLRFPGQYQDDESHLRYNLNRFYDFQLGRYITSDPIGLGGGLNSYNYADGNSVSNIDPLGLRVDFFDGGSVGVGVSVPIVGPFGGGFATGVETRECCLGDVRYREFYFVFRVGPSIGGSGKLATTQNMNIITVTRGQTVQCRSSTGNDMPKNLDLTGPLINVNASKKTLKAGAAASAGASVKWNVINKYIYWYREEIGECCDK